MHINFFFRGRSIPNYDTFFKGQLDTLLVTNILARELT